MWCPPSIMIIYTCPRSYLSISFAREICIVLSCLNICTNLQIYESKLFIVPTRVFARIETSQLTSTMNMSEVCRSTYWMNSWCYDHIKNTNLFKRSTTCTLLKYKKSHSLIFICLAYVSSIVLRFFSNEDG